MNRQTKRMMAKQEKAKGGASAGSGGTGGSGGSGTGGSAGRSGGARKPAPAAGGKKKRTSITQFLREVRQELRKVQWPTRKELWSYTLVVFVAVVILTSYVFGLDYVFSKAVLRIFGS